MKPRKNISEFLDEIEDIFNTVAYDKPIDFDRVLDNLPELYPIQYEEK